MDKTRTYVYNFHVLSVTNNSLHNWKDSNEMERIYFSKEEGTRARNDSRYTFLFNSVFLHVKYSLSSVPFLFFQEKKFRVN